MTDEMIGRLSFPGEIRRFVLAGNSTFTLKDTRSGGRLTFKVKSATKDRNSNWSTGNRDKSMYFVSVLTGGDNESSYSYLGLLREDKINGGYRYERGVKSLLMIDSPANVLFGRFWKLLEQGCQMIRNFEFWHEGQCCRCGRKLTVPESIANGIGPECEGKD